MILIDENNFGTLEFSGNLADKKQFIYGSQLYETIFGVYAEIKLKPRKDITSPEIPIKSIDLTILNYKGTLDLGFHKHIKPICKYKKVFDEEGKFKYHVIIIKFELKAIVSGESEYNSPVQLDKSLSKLNDVKPNEKVFLYVERDLEPIWSHLQCKPPLKNGVFDNEFFIRNGTRYERRKIIEVPNYYYLSDRNKVYPDQAFYTQPGFNCKTSTLRVKMN